MHSTWKVLILRCAAPGVAALHCTAAVPAAVGDGVSFRDWRLACSQGFRLVRMTQTDGLEVRARKDGAERRLLAFEVPRRIVTPSVRTLVARMSLKASAPAMSFRPVVMFRDARGNAWYRIGAESIPADGKDAEAAVRVRPLQSARFNQPEKVPFDLDRVTSVWFGTVVDGSGDFTLRISELVATNQTWRPSRPAALLRPGAVRWRVGRDRAVKAKVTTPAKGGPDGGPLLMRLDFTFPGGRHMYVTPSASIREIDLSLYGGVRIRYRAALPQGIKGLLFMLVEEGGAQYFADPPPPPSSAWQEIVVPFAAFRHGEWTRDANGRLDLDYVAAVVVGAHGTASGKGGDGWIELAEVAAVPTTPGEGRGKAE